MFDEQTHIFSNIYTLVIKSLFKVENSGEDANASMENVSMHDSHLLSYTFN